MTQLRIVEFSCNLVLGRILVYRRGGILKIYFRTNSRWRTVPKLVMFFYLCNYAAESNGDVGWWRSTVVERRSLAGELPCPTLDLHLTSDQSYGYIVRCGSAN